MSLFDLAKQLKAEINEAFANTIQVDKSAPRYNPEHVKELAATVYGESSANPEEMRAIIDTVLNRRKQLGLNIKEVLTQKNPEGLYHYRAYGTPEYRKYLDNKLDRPGEPEKKAMLDNIINELQYGNYKPSNFTNFERAERTGAVKIGDHYFRTEFQGNRKKK